MAVLNRKHGFLFLAEPYSASRAVRDALLTVEGSQNVGHHHITLEELRRSPEIGDIGKLLTFAVARNPFDRLVTHYHHMTGSHKDGFERFVRDQIRRGSIFYHLNDAQLWLYYHKLEPALNDVMKKYGVSLQLPVVGVTRGKQPWQSYYSEGLLHEVANSLREFRRFPPFRSFISEFETANAL